MNPILKTVLLLVVSNCFMLTAWYLHLRQWLDRPWYIAAILSWGIAFFEYMVHVPANRLGNTVLTLPQLQILQVALSLLFFMPFAAWVMHRPVSLDYFWASACLVAAVFFIFRSPGPFPVPAQPAQVADRSLSLYAVDAPIATLGEMRKSGSKSENRDVDR